MGEVQCCGPQTCDQGREGRIISFVSFPEPRNQLRAPRAWEEEPSVSGREDRARRCQSPGVDFRPRADNLWSSSGSRSVVHSGRLGRLPSRINNRELATSGGSAGASPPPKRQSGWLVRATSFSRNNPVPRARLGTDGVRLEGLGHANGENGGRQRGSLAKLGPVLVGEPSTLEAGASQAPRRANPGGPGPPPGAARGPQEANRHHRNRLSRL